MTKQYQGLVIGGPADGKMVSWRDTLFQYHVPPEPPTEPYSMEDFQKVCDEEVTVHQYQFTSLRMVGLDPFLPSKEVVFGFWVDREANVEDAIRAIYARYQEPRRHRALLKRAFEIIRRLWGHAVGDVQLNEDARKLLEDIDREDIE